MNLCGKVKHTFSRVENNIINVQIYPSNATLRYLEKNIVAVNPKYHANKTPGLSLSSP